MTAQEVYEIIKNYGNYNETTICHLHKPQNIPCYLDPNFNCTNISHTQLLDFDKVTTDYCSDHDKEIYSSTDALSYKSNHLLFIEIKGWRQFVLYQLQNKFNQAKIEKQENEYNLNKKFEESILVCKDIITPNTFPADENIIYILIIDTDSKRQDAKYQLLQNLNTLAYDSSSIYVTIDKVTDAHLQESVKRPVRKMRVFCQNFDQIFNNL